MIESHLLKNSRWGQLKIFNL